MKIADSIKNLKLRYKILIPVLLITTLVIIGIATLISIIGSKYIKNEKEKEIENISKQYSIKVEQNMGSVMEKVEVIASMAESIRNSGSADRKSFTENLKKVLKDSPEVIFGVWNVWEPNAFDGNDRNYINAKFHDNTGRYIPYWNRGKGGIDLEPVVDYVSEDPDNYYTYPKTKNKEMITEATEYNIAGKKTTVVSIESPIRDDNGKFIGLVGMDLTLNDIVKMINEIRPYKKGYAYLISNKGNIVSHPDKELIGKNIGEIDKEFEKKI